MKKTKTSSLLTRLHGAPAFFFAGALLLAPFAIHAKAAAPDDKKDPTVRVIEGEVDGKGGGPVQGAVVYLKDTKTLLVKSYLTDQAGHYRFGQLSLTTDYDLWGEKDGNRSKTKHISSFNSKPTLDYTLKLGE